MLTTRQIMATGLRHANGNVQHFIPLVEPVRFDDPGDRPLDAYLLGVLLGDGGMAQTHDCNMVRTPEAGGGPT